MLATTLWRVEQLLENNNPNIITLSKRAEPTPTHTLSPIYPHPPMTCYIFIYIKFREIPAATNKPAKKKEALNWIYVCISGCRLLLFQLMLYAPSPTVRPSVHPYALHFNLHKSFGVQSILWLCSSSSSNYSSIGILNIMQHFN